MIERIEKPWGYEILFSRTERYAGKLLFVRKGEALSLQYHRLKDETIYVHSGRLSLQVGQPGAALAEGRDLPLTETLLHPGASWHLPPLTRHRFIGVEDTTLFEVSTPELEDVVRLEDRYGRAGTIER